MTRRSFSLLCSTGLVALLLSCNSTESNPTVSPNDTTATTHQDSTTNDTTGTSVPIGSFQGDTAEGGACIWVEPYRRSDGTCVRGHWTSAPGKTCSRVGKVYKNCD